MAQISIDYIGHSGFLVETETSLMLFDYYRGDLSVLDAKPADKPLFVFASHAHGDHYNPAILKLAEKEREVHYFFSFDIILLKLCSLIFILLLLLLLGLIFL